MANTRVTTPVTDFDKTNTTQGLKLPSGTNSNQPTGVDAIQGMLRNNTEETVDSSASALAHYNGTEWRYFAATESVDNPIVASQNFNTVLYDGNSGSNVINTVGFQPDLVWTKARNYTGLNGLTNSIDGDNTFNIANTTAAIGTNSSAPKSFNSLGFTLGAGNNNWNGSAYDYVAWNWKGGGAYVNNTDGSITSQVSANAAAGFSIVRFNSGTNSSYTVGTGLNAPPEIVISKVTNVGTANWPVFHKDFTNPDQAYIYLASTAGVVNYGSSLWNYSNWGTNKIGATNVMFGSNNTVINYCWHSVPGYSKIGSYTGNGSTNGPTVALGFEPSFLMCKETSSTGNWRIMDNTRQPSNPKSNGLWANLTNAESTSPTNLVNFNSDNFQVVGGGSDVNASGQTYIYMAFATS